MNNLTVTVDEDRAAALEAAVFAGGAASVQAAVESAVDACLGDLALADLTDEALHQFWRIGLNSGDAGALDFNLLKSEARTAMMPQASE